VIGTILGAFAVAAALIRVLLPLWRARCANGRVIAGAMVATRADLRGLPVHARGRRMGAVSVLLGWRWAWCSR
jgi:hypothetical protein